MMQESLEIKTQIINETCVFSYLHVSRVDGNVEEEPDIGSISQW